MIQIPNIDTGSGGFTEAGIATTQTASWLDVLSHCGHWEEAWAGQTPPSVLQLWGLDGDVNIRERLLVRSGEQLGFIRLFDVSALPPGKTAKRIRPDTRSWDTGGIFDLDLRVGELLPFVPLLKDKGWHGVSPKPVDWQFGELEVREWLVQGTDDVVFALIERLAPPLAEFQGMAGFGRVFNSSQIVRDVTASIHFYQSLGFQMVVDFSGPLRGRGGEVLGLSSEQAPETPVRLVIMQPRGELNGSVELVSFEDAGETYRGKDVSLLAKPWNRGLNLLRFPVQDLEAIITQARQHGVEPAAVVTTRLEPWGEVQVAALTSPDGAWLEFYQPRGWGPG